MTDRTTTGPTDGAASADRIEMIRSEERIRVRTERVPARRARLEKYVVTEQRTIMVEVRHEEVRLVLDDLSDDAASIAPGSSAGRPSPEFVLSEERIEVHRVVVPVERVRLVVDVVTEQREVTGTARLERVVAEQRLDEAGSTPAS